MFSLPIIILTSLVVLHNHEGLPLKNIGPVGVEGRPLNWTLLNFTLAQASSQTSDHKNPSVNVTDTGKSAIGKLKKLEAAELNDAEKEESSPGYSLHNSTTENYSKLLQVPEQFSEYSRENASSGNVSDVEGLPLDRTSGKLKETSPLDHSTENLLNSVSLPDESTETISNMDTLPDESTETISNMDTLPDESTETISNMDTLLDNSTENLPKVETRPDNSLENLQNMAIAPLNHTIEFDNFTVKIEIVKRSTDERILSGPILARIIGGMVTPSHPWYASVLFDGNLPGGLTPSCGGFLVTQRHVLTAAHCFYREQFGNKYIRAKTVQLGKNTINRQWDYQIDVQASFVHPQYDSSLLNNDIAVIKMARAMERNLETVKPIQTLSPAGMKKFGSRFQVSVAGYGATEYKEYSEELLITNLFVDQSLCTRSPNFDPKKQLCAKGIGRRDSCRGDSGSPLLARMQDGEFAAVGIVSFGLSTNCRGDKPSVNTAISYYVPWINSVITT